MLIVESMPDIDPIQLDERYLSEFKENSIPSGIDRLLMAVMEQALYDLRYGVDLGHVLDWAFYDGPGTCFAYLSICDFFGIDSAKLRSAISRFVLAKYSNYHHYLR